MQAPGENVTIATTNEDSEPELGATDYADNEFLMSAAIGEAMGDPRTLDEAHMRPDWPEWERAITKELESMATQNVWSRTTKPPNAKVIGSKWVFKIKRDKDGKIEKYKARLVAQGFTQVHGVNYTETFAPVAKLASLRTTLSIAASNDWPIEVFDFNSAFLNGELDPSEQIYM